MTAMPTADQSREARQLEEDMQRLRGLRPIDDDFMRCLFRGNIPLAQFVLRIIMGKPDLVITDLNTQADMKRLAGARSLTLDVYATDDSKKKYDIEVQREGKGARPRRARYLKETKEGVETMCKAFEESRLDSAITASIDTYKEFGLDDEKIVDKITERFGISFESAIRYVNEANLIMA